jgi:hypothetical protein
MVVSAHAQQAVQVRVKTVSNEGHFTIEAETVFRSYVPSHSSEVTEVSNKALPTCALRAMQVRLRSISNEGRFTIEAETISHQSPHVLQWGG